MVYVKRISAALCALVVCLLAVLSINIQDSYAVDVDGYPEHIPNNLIILQVTTLSGNTTDSFYLQLPLSMDDVTDSTIRWNMRDIDGDVIGTYHISYSDNMLLYSFDFEELVTDVFVDFNNLVFTPKGEQMTFLKFTADKAFSGSFLAETFHIDRGLEDTTFSQSVQREPLATEFPTLSANTYANATLTASGYDVFTQYYTASFYRTGDAFDRFIIAVPTRLWEPLDIIPPLSDSLDFEQEIAETIVVSDFPTDWTSWLSTAVGGFFDFEFLPGFTFGTLFLAVIGILLFMFFIHVFKG